MKDFYAIMLLSIFAILSSYALQEYGNMHERQRESDTIYVTSHYEYLLINDSTLRKVLVTDTLHYLDSLDAQYPINTIRIIRIDEK